MDGRRRTVGGRQEYLVNQMHMEQIIERAARFLYDHLEGRA